MNVKRFGDRNALNKNLYYYYIIIIIIGSSSSSSSSSSKIQLEVYYQCCVLIDWVTTRLHLIAH